MKIRSQNPFWPIYDGLPFSYPALDRNLSSDVAIVGGGLCGAMTAYHLAEAGIDALVLDKRDIGAGSTSASTALVMYAIDQPLSDLIKIRGEDAAIKSYKQCWESTEKIDRLVKHLGVDCHFTRKNSVCFASRASDASALREECETRRQHGFKVTYLDQNAIESNFSFSRPAGILSPDDAEVDPYLLTHFLLDAARKKGLKVYDRTEVAKYERSRDGVVLTTDRGFQVRARKLIFATGYETPQYIKRKVVKLKSTYAIVTEPVAHFAGWGFDQCLIWETARPYLYMRTTVDGRIMVGGEDEDFVNPTRRDGLIPEKAKTLLRKVSKLFPQMDLEIAYAWAGTFGETEDALPYIGEVPEFPHAYFALCYGANGTNFALMGAEIIRDIYLGKLDPRENIFGFSRAEKD